MILNNHLIQNNKIELTSFVDPFPRIYLMSCNCVTTKNVVNAFSDFPDTVPGYPKERVYNVITLLR